MVAADYASAIALWQRTEGMGLGESDTEAAIGAFLARNPGCSAIALIGAPSRLGRPYALMPTGEAAGVVLCGHDGRRGYLHHLAVAPGYRGRGLAKALIAFCFARLAEVAIQKCNIYVYRENEPGVAFWRHNGWAEPTWKVFQKRVEC